MLITLLRPCGCAWLVGKVLKVYTIYQGWANCGLWAACGSLSFRKNYIFALYILFLLQSVEIL